MIILDYKDRRPIYEQVIEKLEELMFLGVLKEHDPMPSVRSLAMDLSINPNTIQRAYAELERRGYIYVVKGKGSFVSDTGSAAESKRKELQAEFKGCVEKALAAGFTEEELTTILKQSITEIKMGNCMTQNLQNAERQGD